MQIRIEVYDDDPCWLDQWCIEHVSDLALSYCGDVDIDTQQMYIENDEFGTWDYDLGTR